MLSARSLISEARRRAGISQAELARRLQVSQPVVARLESGGANPTVETLNRVIEATGHSLNVALGAPSGIDETMIKSDLRRSPEERLQQFEAFYRFAREFGGKALRPRGP